MQKNNHLIKCDWLIFGGHNELRPPRLHTLNQNIGANYFKTKMKPKPTWREDSWTFVWAKESLSKPDTKG